MIPSFCSFVKRLASVRVFAPCVTKAFERFSAHNSAGRKGFRVETNDSLFESMRMFSGTVNPSRLRSVGG